MSIPFPNHNLSGDPMKLRKVTNFDPVERLAVSVRQSTLAALAAYQEHYKKTYGEEIERSQLVEEILRDYMETDKAFQKALSSSNPPKPAPHSSDPD